MYKLSVDNLRDIILLVGESFKENVDKSQEDFIKSAEQRISDYFGNERLFTITKDENVESV